MLRLSDIIFISSKELLTKGVDKSFKDLGNRTAYKTKQNFKISLEKSGIYGNSYSHCNGYFGENRRAIRSRYVNQLNHMKYGMVNGKMCNICIRSSSKTYEFSCNRVAE